MNIAHILPHSIKLPLEVHNGRYDWMLQLARLQVESGHTVTIYSHPDSKAEGLKTLGIDDYSDDIRRNNIATFMLAFSGNHDIFHSHFDNLHYEVAGETPKNIVFTQHWWPHDITLQLAKTSKAKNVWAVPPTKYMHGFDLENQIQTKGHIYHGINLKKFRPTDTRRSDRLLFVGRISPEKNLETAITVAENTGLGLDIIGKISAKNQDYWETLTGRIDGSQIQYLGSKSSDELVGLYAAASALLFPSDVNEPFGLVAIEAQACGTPVLMKKGGSRGELVIDGETGYLCQDLDEFERAAHRATSLKSSDCVAFANRFDIRFMLERYEELYAELT